MSLPSRGAWIETYRVSPIWRAIPRRSLHGERGLKQKACWRAHKNHASLPSRGAWIETVFDKHTRIPEFVAPFTGSVD